MKNFLLIALIIALAGCKDTKKTGYTPQTKTKESPIDIAVTEHPGKKLMETKCYICHSPTMAEGSRIAPPMVAIKARYGKDYDSKEEFANAIWAFVEKPTKENAKLKGAVKNFGLMPYQPYPEKEIRSISEFIFEYQIEEPEWFNKHWEAGHGERNYKQKGKKIGLKDEGTKSHAEKGMEYALSTKMVLGKNLMHTIQKKGTLAAMEFCNVQAYPLTDSMAKVHNAKIKRVSDKPRNPKNKADTKELKHISYFKNAIASGVEYEPIVEYNDGAVQFYSPIITNTMCLQCHGTPKENITPEVLKSLADLYPKDEAKGYTKNEVRGIWSIYFEQK